MYQAYVLVCNIYARTGRTLTRSEWLPPGVETSERRRITAALIASGKTIFSRDMKFKSHLRGRTYYRSNAFNTSCNIEFVPFDALANGAPFALGRDEKKLSDATAVSSTWDVAAIVCRQFEFAAATALLAHDDPVKNTARHLSMFAAPFRHMRTVGCHSDHKYW